MAPDRAEQAALRCTRHQSSEEQTEKMDNRKKMSEDLALALAKSKKSGHVKEYAKDTKKGVASEL